MDPSTFSPVPFLASFVKNIIRDEEVERLQYNKDLISAYAILVGTIRLYDGAKFLDIRRRQGFQRRETIKENRRHQIDPGVGTLGGQARGEQQFIVLLCLKGTGIRIMLF